MSERFRTRTGQTGRDAYLNEAAAIANEQRELTERFRSLLRVVHAEAPELFEHRTDFHPDLGIDATSAKGFLEYLRGHEQYLEWLRAGKPNSHEEVNGCGSS